jgi:hypothetical protein
VIQLVVAHCGANWKYCDGGSIAGGVLMLWLVRGSVKRAERKARERRAARIAAHALSDLAARQQDQPRAEDPPLL